MVFPVYLIGYMGAGKTTVGRLLADKLGWHFVDGHWRKNKIKN